MASGKVLAVLDLTVLKYLASRGYTEACAALRTGIGLDNGQVVSSDYDLVLMFYAYLEDLTREAPHNQVHRQLQGYQLQQGAYEGMLMPADRQGHAHAHPTNDGNMVSRMRPQCGRMQMAMSGMKRKVDGRMVQTAAQPYNQQRYVQFSSGQTLALEQYRQLQQQRNVYQRIRQRNSGISLQGVGNGGNGMNNTGQMHSMQGLPADMNNGQGVTPLSADPQLSVHDQMQPGSGPVGGGGHHLPELSSNLAGYNLPGSANMHSGTVSYPINGNLNAPVVQQGGRTAHSTYVQGSMRPNLAQQYGNNMNMPYQLHGRLPGPSPYSLMADPCGQLGNAATSSSPNCLLSNPLPAPRSLHHAVQLQADVHQPIHGQLPGTGIGPPSVGARYPSGRSEMDEGVHKKVRRDILPLQSSVGEIGGTEKMLMAAAASSTVKEIGPCSHSKVVSGDSLPVSNLRTRVSSNTCESQRGIDTPVATNNSAGNGNSSCGGQAGLGNSSSASSTDVNADMGNVVCQLKTLPSKKDGTDMDTSPSKDSHLDWESSDGGASPSLLCNTPQDMPPIDSLKFDAIHGIDTLEAFLNEPDT